MIGILAYGSLIDNPGFEIEEHTVEIIDNVDTPFAIVFARSSGSRSGAPTLIPVEEGGAIAKAKILVLKESVSLQEAKNFVYRREINKVGTSKRYNPKNRPSKDSVLVETSNEFSDFTSIIYTKISSNLVDTSPEHLANLAIESAKYEGSSKRDGISYLIDVKRNGIVTPLMKDYEKELLRKTNATSLEEAYSSIVS